MFGLIVPQRDLTNFDIPESPKDSIPNLTLNFQIKIPWEFLVSLAKQMTSASFPEDSVNTVIKRASQFLVYVILVNGEHS